MKIRLPNLVSCIAVSVSALLVMAIASQYYRRMPHVFDYTKGLYTSDALVFPDLVMQLATGQASMEDWIGNPSSYWLSQFIPFTALMSVFDHDWRLSLALRSALVSLLMLLALALAVRMASNRSWSRSVAVASVPMAAVLAVDHFFGGEASFSLGIAGHRTYVFPLFLLVCAGLAKAASQHRAACPLCWAYLALCLVMGAEDALLGVAVIVPAFLASLLWLRLQTENRRRGAHLVAFTSVGTALFLTAGFLNSAFRPFLENVVITHDTNFRIGMASAAPSIAEGKYLDAIADFFSGALNHISLNFLEEWRHENAVNSALLLGVALMAAWTVSSRRQWATVSQPRDARTEMLFFVHAMYWSVFLTTASAVLLFHFRVRYATLVLWLPLLLSVVPLSCIGQRGARVAGRLQALLPAAAALMLLAYAAFHRPLNLLTERARCAAGEVVPVGALDRGLVTFWHARESLMMSGDGTFHLMYLGVDLQEESVAFAYRHAGNLRHFSGRADYASIDLSLYPNGIPGFRRQFGLPSRVEECGDEAWYLYAPGWISSDDLFERSYRTT